MLMLFFYVGNKRYAVNTESVIEVIPKILIKPILHVPKFVVGAISYGGIQIPVIDFAILTESVSSTESMHSRIFILSRTKGNTTQYVGILSEKITEAVEIENERMTASGVHVKEFPYFDGIIRLGPDIVQIIEAEQLLISMEGVVL